MELNSALAIVTEHPDNGRAREDLAAAVAKVAPRAAASDPTAGLAVAKAYEQLHQPKLALKALAPILAERPAHTEALALRNRLQNASP
jgi:regulator of sirC expression with transglutaminase-like and TPR domain